MSLEIFRRLDCLRALTRIDFVQETPDDHVRLANSKGVVLATDRPVEERGYIGGEYQRFLLKLRMTKAMIGRWRSAGLLNADQSALMMREHGYGWGNRVADIVGKWEDLRIEARNGHTALVADPAFDPAMMDAWMKADGLEPDAWRGLLSRRTLTHTSVGFTVDSAKMRKLDEQNGLPTYEADWELYEASWVWKGQDTMAGMDRGHRTNTMITPDELRAMAEQAGAAAASKIMIELRGVEKPAVVEIEPIEQRAVFDETASGWKFAVGTAYRDLGPQACDIVAAARATDDPIAALCKVLEEAQQKRQTTPAPPDDKPAPVGTKRHIKGGEQNAYLALQDLETVMFARGLRDVGNGKRDQRERNNAGTLAHLREQAIQAARKVSPYYSTLDPKRMLWAFGRSMGMFDADWWPSSPRELVEELTRAWEPAAQARSASMGGLWLPGEGAVRSQSNSVDILASLRHGGQSGVVPANLPAVYLSIVSKIFLMVHDTQLHDYTGWGRNIAATDLNAQTLIRQDLAVSFDRVKDGQDLPEAFLWDEAVDIQTVPRGITWAMGWEAMFTDGGQQLVNTPAMLAMRWMGAKVAHWFKVLLAGQYTAKGKSTINAYTTGSPAKNASTTSLRDWFNDMLIASGEARPVALPAEGLIQGVTADVPAMGTMEPDLLLHGNRTEQLLSDYFAPRQPSQVNQTSQDQQVTDFAQVLGANRKRTPYISDNTMIALVSGGPAATMSAIGLEGQGMRVTTSLDDNQRRLPEFLMRIVDTFDAIYSHPDSAYRNKP
jgi:hypothetical protein